ncbi:MAG: translation initiation factor IF-3 [Candidatus Yanofskybacteria bacterium RIFOXYD1_FULL_44_17]|nr:MAG: translation initiation factor IF-3 [Candidatus Yanofskybacteria bacterium RIFOXYA1_FULL_44_17]OGN36549.1 MAG: translation initiation factor IF-3 [Candidatus Yanofskybacteria bacterium RIFOXYA2_FULL_45_28]OGN37109.1 MAG: translation initiation factor IF-3 [Candidatus Yanofskybacteria bacterium RIFOXYC1_FULL_44_16]OGN37685.1 MAG: translation initiation factor IF-3 [Candidatus Yanofskybacteria bacterium RIFOXYB1_FULL_44_29]OGN37811.1 MAG: translation initiation factor IF-3 [Candidatus Yano
MLKPLRVNNQIRVPQVAVIDDEGNQLGTMDTLDALKLAKDKELDLVEVNPNSQPPMAKIMDYGKYIYQKEKQEKKSAKKQKDQEMKTVRIGFKTGQHDMDFKAKQIEGFIKEGNPVRIELTLRGREKALAEIGRTKFVKFLTTITEPHIVQEQIKRSPFGWTTIIKK